MAHPGRSGGVRLLIVFEHDRNRLVDRLSPLILQALIPLTAVDTRIISRRQLPNGGCISAGTIGRTRCRLPRTLR